MERILGSALASTPSGSRLPDPRGFRPPEFGTDAISVNRPLADHIQGALAELAAAPSRVSGTAASRMVRRVRRDTGCSREDYRELWASPERWLGPFASLPAPLRAALADAADLELRERSFTVSDRLHRAVYGPAFRLGSALARIGRRHRLTEGWRRRAWRSVHLFGRSITAASRAAGRAWVAMSRRGPLGRTSVFQALWRWAGVDPGRVAVEYLEDLPYDPTVSPVHRATRRGVESCALVGVDLLPSGGELVYLEANFNPGMGLDRMWAYDGDDPVGKRLCRYAHERGFRRIVYFPSSMWHFEREMEEAWRRQAGALGLELEIRDDPALRSPWRRPWEPRMDFDAAGTLYVNSRQLASPLCYVIREKGLLDLEIERHNALAPEPDRIPMARRVHDEEDLVPPEPGSRFPNLIVKDPLRDMGTGLALYKVDRIPDGLESTPHLMFEYMLPELQGVSEKGEPGDFGIAYRAYLLITPDGPVYLGAKVNVGDVPVPAELPPGRIEDIRPYVINGTVAATARAVTAREEEALEAATLRVGRVIHAFLRRKHDLEPAVNAPASPSSQASVPGSV